MSPRPSLDEETPMIPQRFSTGFCDYSLEYEVASSWIGGQTNKVDYDADLAVEAITKAVVILSFDGTEEIVNVNNSINVISNNSNKNSCNFSEFCTCDSENCIKINNINCCNISEIEILEMESEIDWSSEMYAVHESDKSRMPSDESESHQSIELSSTTEEQYSKLTSSSSSS